MTLLIAGCLLLIVLAAASPLRVGNGAGSAAPAASGGGGDAGGSSAGGSGAGEASGGGAAADSGADSAAAAVRASAGALGIEDDAPATGDAPTERDVSRGGAEGAEPDEGGEQPAANPFARAARQQDEVPEALRALTEVPDEWLAQVPEAERPAVAELVGRLGQKIFAERYVPAARELLVRERGLAERARQWQTWYQQEMQPLLEGAAWPIAQRLAAEPQTLAIVNDFLSGGAPQRRAANGAGHAPAGEEPDLEALDEPTRRVFAAIQSDNQQLRAELEQMAAEMGEVRGWRQDADQQQQQARRSQARYVAASQFEDAAERIAQHIGFDPRRYTREWNEALRLAAREVRADLAERAALPPEEQAGAEPPNVPALLWECLQRAGFQRIIDGLERSRAGAAPPPPDRAGHGRTGEEDAGALVRQTAAALGIRD